MASRTTTEKQRSWLSGEIQAWRAQGLISGDQASSILGLYGSAEEFADQRRSKALLVLMGAAGFLLGLAVLLVVGYNWEALPKAAKLILIFGCILGTHGAGLWLRFVRKSEIGSESAFFLGCLLYGAGIALLAQIFNINSHYPDGIWWWAIGTLPFALCMRTPLLHALMAALLAVWCGTEVMGDPTRGIWWFFGPAPVPNGAYTLPLLVLPGLAWAYSHRSATVVGLYVAVTSWWVILLPVSWHFEAGILFFIGMVGGLLLLASEIHEQGSLMAIPYRFFGTALAAGVLVPLSFHEAVNAIAHESSRHPVASGVALFGLALCGLALVLVARLVFKPGAPGGGWGALLRRQWFPAGLMLLMLIAQAIGNIPGGWLPVVLLANVAMLVTAFWLMQTGLREDRGRPFFGGVIYFVLWAILRYVDLFGEMGGMLGAAAMFFMCGLGLFLVALYWRGRKRIQHA